MDKDDDAIFGAPRILPPVHVVGQQLDDLSVAELGLRIDALQAEIVRLEQARAAKEASRSTAAGFFKAIT